MNQPVKAVLFDQDGTIMDSGPGIKHAAILTLEKMNLKAPSYEDLNYFVGPPLRDCFRLSHVPEERIEEAVEQYRIFYEEKGYSLDATPYPGIIELLKKLHKEGYKTYICTSKGEPLAKRILTAFKLIDLFDGVNGASLDGSHAKKKDIIASCLTTLPKGSKAVMVGDTYLDIEGANQNHIPGIGVTWGYGDNERMKKEGAVALADTTDSLFEAIKKVLG